MRHDWNVEVAWRPVPKAPGFFWRVIGVSYTVRSQGTRVKLTTVTGALNGSPVPKWPARPPTGRDRRGRRSLSATTVNCKIRFKPRAWRKWHQRGSKGRSSR
jgi:hypothetical protein